MADEARRADRRGDRLGRVVPDGIHDLSAYAARIEAGRYAVVLHLVRKSGHIVGDKLKDACTAAGVQFVAARSAGVRGLVEALGDGS